MAEVLFAILTRKTNTWLNIALEVAIFSSDMQNIVEIDRMPLLTAKHGKCFFKGDYAYSCHFTPL